MPLRDHFHGPVADRHSWDALHAAWPTVMVMALKRRLPPGYVALPHIHLGTTVEIDVASFEQDLGPGPDPASDNGGVATATWAPPKPTLDAATELPDQDVYEVRVFDTKHDRRLVAAVELVSPSNKESPSERRSFVGKCAGLLREGVSVAIVDIVTEYRANLYAELIEFVGLTDPAVPADAPATYASACRWARGAKWGRLQTWYHGLAIGAPLPELPLWLTPNLPVQLELEPTYEQACSIVSVT